MKKFLFSKLSLKEYNTIASAPFELGIETEKAVLVKFSTERGIKEIWIPKKILKDTQSKETNENEFLVKGAKYKHKTFGICEVVGFTDKSVILDTLVGTKQLLTKIAANFLEKI